ncbi:hypothetical protein Cni_G28141 [Canna indica]|uniref:Uncharacterized protein n=1 Tax=Canna indica TaxID=4628 RepID=A0AAQ3L668_9LILI|nr:hypothetical protein Cni_G28141 [Canna indica]
MRTGGWRRAFCTSVGEDPEVNAVSATRMEAGEQQKRTPSPSPTSCAKLNFFSGGSGSGSNLCKPRLALVAAGIRCRSLSKSLDSPKLQCARDTPPAVTPTSSPSTTSPISTASSPRSPSKFARFKLISRSRCRLCSQSLKPSHDAPVFTAECSHDFHFPCIVSHVKGRGSLSCPVCSATWRQAPLLLAVHHDEAPAAVEQGVAGETDKRNPNRKTASGGERSFVDGREPQLEQNRVPVGATAAKLYNDDEPLLFVSKVNPGGALRFNPIPEVADEEENENEENDLEPEDELQGLLANPASRCRSFDDGGIPCPPPTRSTSGGIQVSVMQQAALLSEGRRHRNYVVALKVKAPPIQSAHLGQARGRAPIDLVMVLDVSRGMTGEKLHMLKHSMRLVISSLGPADRLSMVAFSVAAGAKRLLPLHRMSRYGQRAARQIVERLVVVSAAATTGGTTVSDALRKASKVLEDRRERNPVATIMLLSDAAEQQQRDERGNETGNKNNHHHHHKPVYSPLDSGGNDIWSHPASTMAIAASTTRFARLEIPVVAPPFGDGAAETSPKNYNQVPTVDAFLKCVGGLVSVVMQDVQLQLVFPSGEISTVYPSAAGGVGSCQDVELRGRCSILRLGDLYAGEEREMLVELRVPSSSPATVSRDSCHQLSVKCNYKDPTTREVTYGAEQILLFPPLHHHAEAGRAASSSASSISSLQLRNLFVSTRAVVESRRLAELSDYATAHHLLSSARIFLLQYDSDAHLVQNLDDELADLQRQQHQFQLEESVSPSGRSRRRRAEHPAAAAEARGGPLTPTSAWRAAEQLAKVAIMRKSLNRVGDLHGFENARF